MEEASVCGKVTIYGGKASNTTCLFVPDIILLVYVLKCLKKGDIYAERQQRDEAENTDRVRPALLGAGGIKHLCQSGCGRSRRGKRKLFEFVSECMALCIVPTMAFAERMVV